MQLPNYSNRRIPEVTMSSGVKLFYTALYERAIKIQPSAKVVAKGGGKIICFYLPSGEEIRVTQLGYQEPDIIYVVGESTSNGNAIVVLAHPYTLQLVVRIVEPEADQQPRTKLGFPEFIGALDKDESGASPDTDGEG